MTQLLFLALVGPEVGPEKSVVLPQVRNLRAVIWVPFPISSLVFLSPSPESQCCHLVPLSYLLSCFFFCPQVRNLSAVIWFPFPISSLVFLSPSPESQGCHLVPLSHLLSCFFCLVLLLFLSGHLSANGPFSQLFSQKILQHFLWRVRLFRMSLVEQLGDDSW